MGVGLRVMGLGQIERLLYDEKSAFSVFYSLVRGCPKFYQCFFASFGPEAVGR